MKEPSFPTIQRTEVQTTLRRKRERPKKAVGGRLLPMMDEPRNTVNFDITHQTLSSYKELVGKIFSDPNTNRPYIITVVCYNKTLKKPMAYRRNSDDWHQIHMMITPLKLKEMKKSKDPARALAFDKRA